MFQPNTGARPLNAIAPFHDTAEDRTARHMRQCRELAELGMQLARVVAQKALADWTAPAEPTAPAAKMPDAALLFTRLSTAVRQAIALEARLAASLANARAGARAPDYRREPIRQAIELFTETHPDRKALRREALERLDRDMAAEPDSAIEAAEILEAICADLHIVVQYDVVPTELLNRLDGTAFLKRAAPGQNGSSGTSGAPPASGKLTR